MLLLLFNTGVYGLLGKQPSDSTDRDEFSHHTNGSKAPTSAHFMICGTLVVVEICGMIVSFRLNCMLVIL